MQAMTDFLTAYWWVLIVAVVAVGVGVYRFRKTRDERR